MLQISSKLFLFQLMVQNEGVNCVLTIQCLSLLDLCSPALPFSNRSLLAHPREKRFPKLHHTRTTRAGCSLGTCQVQNLTHRLFRLVGKTGKDDAAGKATWSPNSYGRKRRSLELKQRGAIERGFRTGSWLVRGSDGKITRMSS